MESVAKAWIETLSLYLKLGGATIEHSKQLQELTRILPPFHAR